MNLGEFEGLDVVGSRVEVRGVSGGLNPALEVDPSRWYTGQRVRVVMDLEVDHVKFPRVKGTDLLARGHVFKLVEGRIGVVESDTDLDRDIVGFLNERQEAVARLFHEQESEAVAAGDPVQQAITDPDLAPVEGSDEDWEAEGGARRSA